MCALMKTRTHHLCAHPSHRRALVTATLHFQREVAASCSLLLFRDTKLWRHFAPTASYLPCPSVFLLYLSHLDFERARSVSLSLSLLELGISPQGIYLVISCPQRCLGDIHPSPYATARCFTVPRLTGAVPTCGDSLGGTNGADALTRMFYEKPCTLPQSFLQSEDTFVQRTQ